MAKKIKISTKLQNILLGSIVFTFCLTLGIKSYKELSTNTENITNQELANLDKESAEVEDSVNRYIKSLFDSMGEIYYDKRIKQASLTSNTRLFSVYQQKSHSALREFALFKNIKNIFLFDDDYNLISSINRSVFLNNQNLDNIKKRLENYKEKQVIFQALGHKKLVMMMLRLDYSELNSAYIVIIDDLKTITNSLPDYETDEIEYFFITRTLDYKDSLIKLKGKHSLNHYSLKEDTLLRYSPSFIRSFNAEGEETISRVKYLENFQFSYVLGLIKPKFMENEIAKSKDSIISKYTFWAIWVLMCVVIFASILISKVNLQIQCILITRRIIAKLNPISYEVKPQELSKQAKRQAYSYIEEENALKNSVFKVYNSLRKMTPEDIRNLSIKNSLSKENIRLVYQPVIDSKTMQPQFCEVFLRLLNYYGEELMPSEFIPVLSHFNMLENLDEMMLEKVTRKIQTLQSTDSAARISLNISTGAFNSDTFLRKLKANLIKGNINTDNVMLEIPELRIIEEPHHSEFIQDLRGYGVHFVVSVKMLDNATIKKVTENKIQYVRINMSDFSDVLENAEKQVILKQIISNAKKHNLQLIAERIETEFMFKLAKSLDIPLLQGYHIGKPKKYYTHK